MESSLCQTIILSLNTLFTNHINLIIFQIMETLQIMPVQRTSSMNFGEFAEEAVIVEEQPTQQKRPLFIEANTIEASLEHLRNDCIIPVFAKDNEATLSHVAFIEAVQDATNTFFSGEQIELPDIRVSHVIKGRIPEAMVRSVVWLHLQGCPGKVKSEDIISYTIIGNGT